MDRLDFAASVITIVAKSGDLKVLQRANEILQKATAENRNIADWEAKEIAAAAIPQ